MPAVVELVREPETATCQLILSCPETKKCAIIDPVLNIDLHSGTVSTKSADELLAFVADKGYTIQWLLDSHVHADHISALHYLQTKTGAPTGIGANVIDVQQHFQKAWNLPASSIEGKFWDHLWKDGDKFQVGNLNVQVITTPGHTPADVSYYIENDCVIVGDSIFQPDLGTARCDFPGGCAHTLWQSVQKLLALPDNVRIFVGHDYPSGGREFLSETTVATQKENNKHVKVGSVEAEFTEARKTRDAQLGLPKLIYPAMQFNIRGGRTPVDGHVHVPLRVPFA